MSLELLLCKPFFIYIVSNFKEAYFSSLWWGISLPCLKNKTKLCVISYWPIFNDSFIQSNRLNFCLIVWTPSHPLSLAFYCHESGATVLSMAPRQQLLITGGRKGWISVLELPHRHQRQSFQAHDSPVKALAVDPTEDCFISGSAEGNIKVFWLVYKLHFWRDI